LLSFSLENPVPLLVVADEYLEPEPNTAEEVVAGDVAVVEAEKAVAMVEEEDVVEEDEVEEEDPLWLMASTFQMSLDLSLTKNGELSPVRADDMSTKSASGNAPVQTKEIQEKSPQLPQTKRLMPRLESLLMKLPLSIIMEELAVLLALDEEPIVAVAVEEQAVD
jgi:hypothetical protein